MTEIWNFVSANFVWVLIGVVVLFIIIGICIANFSYDNFLKKLNEFGKIESSFWDSTKNFAEYVSKEKFNEKIRVETKDDVLSEGTYSPQNLTITLKPEAKNSNSVAGIAIVAHEFGHALQHLKNPEILIKNNKYHNIVKILGNLNWVVLILAVVLSFAVDIVFSFVGLGLILINVTVALGLKISTIHLEKDASKNAIMLLNSLNIFQQDEIECIKKFLNSALGTYTADFFAGLLSWTGLVKKTKFF